MMRKVAFCGFATFALASSALAYIYTCGEGKFQIDVPEGWEMEISKEKQTIQLISDVKNISHGCITIMFVNVYDLENGWLNSNRVKELLEGDNITINEIHDWWIDEMIKDGFELTEDKYLSKNDLTKMNVESGFIIYGFRELDNNIIYGGFLLKGDIIYTIGSEAKVPYYSLIENTVINTLNSFKVLDEVDLNNKIKVPYVKGLWLEEAKELINKAGLKYTTCWGGKKLGEGSIWATSTKVISQYPIGGSMVDKGDNVILYKIFVSSEKSKMGGGIDN